LKWVVRGAGTKAIAVAAGFKVIGGGSIA